MVLFEQRFICRLTDTSIATDINNTEKTVTTEMDTETISSLETSITVMTTLTSLEAEEVEVEDGEAVRLEAEVVMGLDRRYIDIFV